MATDTSDTTLFDIKEKVDILLKAAFGFPSTSDKKPWYLETNVKFNNYLFGEEVFLKEITSTPVFNSSGVKTLQQSGYGLLSNDFVNFSDNSSNPNGCSIVDDTTGTIRRFQNLILDPCPGLGNNTGDSWFKYDTSLNQNILSDTLQFNYKQYTDQTGAPQQPYKYQLTSQQAITKDDPYIPLGEDGGNWNLDFKSGILLFLDSENLSLGTRDQSYNVTLQNGTDGNGDPNFTNKPVFTFYKYIGDKGVAKLGNDITTLESRVNALDLSNDVDVSNLSRTVTDLSGYVDGLNLSISSLTQDIENRIDLSLTNFRRDISLLDLSLNQIITIDLSNLKSRLTNIETSFNLAIPRIDLSLSTIFTRLSTHDTSLSSVFTNVSSLTTRVDSSLSSVFTNVALNASKLTVHDTSLSNVFTNVSNLTTRVDSSLSSLSTSVSTLTTRVDASLSTLSTSVTSLSSRVDSSLSTVFTNVSSLTTRVDSSLTTLSTNVAANTSKLTLHDNSLSSVSTSVSSLTTRVDSSLSSVFSDVSSLTTRVDSSLSSVFTNVSGLTSRVDASLSSLSTSVSSLSSSLDSSFTAISQSFTTEKISVAGDISSSGHIYASQFRNTTGTELIIDPRPFESGSGSDFSGTVIIRGDLRVKGTTTTVNTQTLSISGNLVEINASDSLFDTGGLVIDFSGTTGKKYLTYNEVTNVWDFSGETVSIGDFKLSGVTFTQIKQNIDTSLSSLNTKITQDISSLRNSFDLSLNNKADKTYVDGSLSRILTDISNRIDISISTAFNDISLLEQRLDDISLIASSNTEVVNICGQTFLQVMTQQPNLFKYVNYTNSSTSINLEWNFDNIIATQNGTVLRLGQDFNNDIDTSGSNELLPVIKQIYIDISQGAITGNYAIIECSNNYNTSSHKNFTLNRVDSILGINKDEVFDVIVYGKNGATNIPSIDDRKLVFTVSFEEALRPDPPLIHAISAYTIPTDFSITRTTPNDILSSTVRFYNIGPERLFAAELEYSVNTTVTKYRSDLYQDNSSSNSVVFTDSQLQDSISGQTFLVNFNDTNLSSLYGTSYQFRIRTKNNVNQQYSNYSNTVPYTLTGILPDNLIPTPTDIQQTLTPITQPTTGNTIYVYDNNNNTIITVNDAIVLLSPDTINDEVRFSSSYNLSNILPTQTVLLTDTSADSCGKSVDNQIIATFKTDINNEPDSSSLINIYGFSGETITSDLSFYSLTKTNTGNFIKNILVSDVYDDNNNVTHKSKRGWHIKAKIDFVDTISYDLFLNPTNQQRFGFDVNTGYTIKYLYTRQDSAKNGITTGVTNNDIQLNKIFTEILLQDPSYNTHSFETSGVTILRNFGLPSINTFSYTIKNKYTNINSNRRIMTNKQFAYIDSILDTNINTRQSITAVDKIEDSSIPYQKDIIVNSVHYTQPRITTIDNNLKYVVKIDNIKYSAYDLSQNSDEVNHLCDYNSYKKDSNNKIDTTKIAISGSNYIRISEITDISSLSTNITGINVVRYQIHNNPLKLWSLLYYNGVFRSCNEYPKVTDFSFGNLTPSYLGPDLSSNRYNISGELVSSGEKGYNWIVITLETNSNQTWKIGDRTITPVNDTIDLSDILLGTNDNNRLFTNNTVNKIFSNIENDSGLDAIGFIRSKIDNVLNGELQTNTIIGSLKRATGQQRWTEWSSNTYAPTSVIDIFRGQYRSYYGARDSMTSNKKITIDTGKMKKYNIEIFIGLSDTNIN